MTKKIREKDTREAPQPEGPFLRPLPPGTKFVRTAVNPGFKRYRKIPTRYDRFFIYAMGLGVLIGFTLAFTVAIWFLTNR